MKFSNSILAIIPLFAVTSFLMIGCGNKKGSAAVGVQKALNEQQQIEKFLTTFDSTAFSYERTNPANQQFAGQIEGSTAIVERVAAGEGKYNYKTSVTFVIKGETESLNATAIISAGTTPTRLQVVDVATMQSAKGTMKYGVEAVCYGVTCNNLITRLYLINEADGSKPKAQTVVIFVRPDADAIKQNIAETLRSKKLIKDNAAKAKLAAASVSTTDKTLTDKAAAEKAAADKVEADKLAAAAAADPAPTTTATTPTSNMVDGPVTYVIRWSASPTADFAGGMKVSAEQALAAHPRLPVANAAQAPAAPAAPGSVNPVNQAPRAANETPSTGAQPIQAPAPSTSAPAAPVTNDGSSAGNIPGSLNAVPQAGAAPSNTDEALRAAIADQTGQTQLSPQGQNGQMEPGNGNTEQAVAPIVK